MRGFTILEVMFSIAVIVLALGAVLTLASFSASIIPITSQKLIATYLAQEGIETVRNIRDSNWLRDINWRGAAEIGLVPNGDFEADYGSSGLVQVYGGNFLRIDSNGYYNYTSGNQTKFQRKISVSDNADADPATEDIKIVSLVMWQEKQRNYSVTAEAWLYNWK